MRTGNPVVYGYHDKTSCTHTWEDESLLPSVGRSLALRLCRTKADILCVTVWNSYFSYYNVTLTFQARAAAPRFSTHVCMRCSSCRSRLFKESPVAPCGCPCRICAQRQAAMLQSRLTLHCSTGSMLKSIICVVLRRATATRQAPTVRRLAPPSPAATAGTSSPHGLPTASPALATARSTSSTPPPRSGAQLTPLLRVACDLY